jgi:hypothetical protein
MKSTEQVFESWFVNGIRDVPRTGDQKVLIRVKRAMGQVGDDGDT